MQITTQQGSLIKVERTDDGGAVINGGKILTPTVTASNGVIHAIDTVILPPPQPPYSEAVNAGPCGGDDGCKFRLTGGPAFTNNGGGEMSLQLFFMHSGLDGGQPQGDYRFAIERDGQLISTFADTRSLALFKNEGHMGPYNYEAKVQVSKSLQDNMRRSVADHLITLRDRQLRLAAVTVVLRQAMQTGGQAISLKANKRYHGPLASCWWAVC